MEAGGDLEEEDLDVFTLLKELARVIKVQFNTNNTHTASTVIHMYNTDTSIEVSMVPDKEDAVHSHVSDTSPLPSERPTISNISEYEVSVFRDVEAAVTAVPDVVCNSGLGTGDMVVEHNETEDEEERIALFLEGGCLCKLLYCTLHSTQFIASML